jgi:hypothetical protein
MPKFPNLTAVLPAVLVFLIAEASLGNPLNYPVVQNPNNYTPFCYMLSTDGKMLDLSNICGFGKPDVCSDTSNKPELAALIKDFCSKNSRCSLTSTCHEIPQTFFRPSPGEPL